MNADDTGVHASFAQPTQCSVMIVDDDELVRAKFTSLLKMAGYEVHCADGASQALLMLAVRPCHIVLTDWEMPEMDGPSLCRALRLRDGERYTYVMMFTVRNNPSDILTGLGAGADDYVFKGAPIEELLARIEVGRRITRLEHYLRITGAENRRLSITDPLTGAHNRRFLMKYLPRELDRSRRYGHPLAVLSCDIDSFKRINDCFGHAAGDEVLQTFVARSQDCTRESIDWIARAGGEEFVIVLPSCPVDEAIQVLERVRRRIAERLHAGGHPVFTVSFGLATSEQADEFHKVVTLADEALLQAKSGGRDQIIVASESRSDPVVSTPSPIPVPIPTPNSAEDGPGSATQPPAGVTRDPVSALSRRA